MLRKVLASLLILAGVMAWLFVSVSGKAQQPPENSPAWFIQSRSTATKSKVVVCIGDSITHGRVSHNYVDQLSQRFPRDKFTFINAGINSELAWNVVQRLETVIACHPDIVTVLIGTNDANATLNEANARRAVKKMKLPREPSRPWYIENLKKICTVLKGRTSAKIALLSLPPIGEAPESTGWHQSVRYSRVIQTIAAEQGVAYLPLNETMVRYLAEQRHLPKHTDATGYKPVMYKGIFSHFVLGKSFDDISEANGFLLVTDFLHLNSRGAAMAADLIGEFVRDAVTF
jgi:lysophospholipase L1-like esterase